MLISNIFLYTAFSVFSIKILVLKNIPSYIDIIMIDFQAPNEMHFNRGRNRQC